MREKNSIIITGSNGMLGNELLNVLSNSNFEIIAFSSKKKQLASKFLGIDNIHVYDNSEVENFKIDNGIWINCSFPRSSNGIELAKSYDFTTKMIDNMKKANCCYMINISSQSVYSQQGTIFPTEETNVCPENLYGMTKYAIEKICKIRCQEQDMKLINIRLGSLASSEFDQRMINKFIDRVLDNEPITIDAGCPKVSYLHIHDAAVALSMLAEKIFVQPELFINSQHLTLNLGNNDYMSVYEIAKEILTIAAKEKVLSSTLEISQRESNYNNVICSDAIYNLINWKPEYTMKLIIDDIWISKVGREVR